MFQGSYYNHQTAASVPVKIQLHPESLQLTIHSTTRPARQLIWLYQEIQPEWGEQDFIRINRPGEEPGTLEVNDPAFVKDFRQHYKRYRGTGLNGLVHHSGLLLTLGVGVLILALIAVGYLVILPWGSHQAAKLLPRSFDQQLGQLARESMHEDIDTAASRLLTDFAAQMKWPTTDSLTFHVAKSDIENAYALPGGYIVVYSGLLEKLPNAASLSALLSHEAAHVSCRHSVQALCQQLSTQVLLTVITGNSGGVASVLYSKANTLHNLSYSRKFEKEADLKGLETLRNNQIDQTGMITLMQELQKISQQQRVPEFISSHPLTTHRIKYVTRQIRKHPAAKTGHPEQERIFNGLLQVVKNNP
ncbi:M48 family metallopeptidase [Chitinophaga nivalis]|uniref:M48 family metallopeptidase n=1 Tax=Chitinophaga nivalis TaxID=2991709 RepID=A0ABT3IPI6_9BACT|nr:M48 family metallopeptidase [Chitinophaga nivalis]MCW3464426.1 M48 family metallopeptidase [Chitinophaga nivalis]MCW3485883.1 M48 family metallopeptidase [Chitinophaga nivalis]